MKRAALILFFIVSVGELVSNLIVVHELHVLCKPLLLISLLFYYVVSVSRAERSGVVLLALSFSWLGDILLLFQAAQPILFMLGLIAFLMAHIFYILAYRQHQYNHTTEALKGIQKLRFSFPIILAGTGLMVVLCPVLGSLRIPVIIYALVMMVMALHALFRYGATTTISFWMVLIGALLFMISDSILALNKFLQPVAYGGFWIMLTYISAQILLVEGLLRHKAQSVK